MSTDANPHQARWREWLAPVARIGNNWISLTGVVLVTTAAILWIFLLPSSLRGGDANPYLSLLSVLALPALFFLGLALIPFGQWLQRRRSPEAVPAVLNLENSDFRRLVTFLAVTTILNVVIGSQLIYKTVHHMETVGFCGQTCHIPMRPEFTAYQHASHSNVECVACHVGPGALSAVKAKWNGIHQLTGVIFDNYSRPIPAPVHNMRPASETCEVCHSPAKDFGSKLVRYEKFADDQANSRTQTVLLMKVGGANALQSIHGAHLGPGVHIRFAHKDDARQEVPWMEYTNSATGKSVTYSTGADISKMKMRDMDCMDCHNRPSHTYEVPEKAIDRSMANGQIDPSLPFIKKRGLELIKADYSDQTEAGKCITAGLSAFYQQNHADVAAAKQKSISDAAKALVAIYDRNVFPEMKVKWGTYPNNLGHNDYPGCFRCHDDSHKSVKDSKITMSQDCGLCHNLVAMDEAEPKVLSDLGLSPDRSATTQAAK